jgi:hypothetical protein
MLHTNHWHPCGKPNPSKSSTDTDYRKCDGARRATRRDASLPCSHYGAATQMGLEAKSRCLIQTGPLPKMRLPFLLAGFTVFAGHARAEKSRRFRVRGSRSSTSSSGNGDRSMKIGREAPGNGSGHASSRSSRCASGWSSHSMRRRWNIGWRGLFRRSFSSALCGSRRRFNGWSRILFDHCCRGDPARRNIWPSLRSAVTKAARVAFAEGYLTAVYFRSGAPRECALQRRTPSPPNVSA